MTKRKKATSLAASSPSSPSSPSLPASPRLTVSASSPVSVIGLGGSAGALAAFETFFKAMPADSGAAFVVIQHLLPTRESMLSEILAQHTPMRVVQAGDRMVVEPNCVYVIPPNHHLAIREGVLLFHEAPLDHGLRLPIDFFFRSLAEDREERAICILFSGAGSDGTSGARAIRGGGGMVIAQDPVSAQFGSMPGSVTAAGLADRILPPEDMPQAILQFLQHPYVKGQEQAATFGTGEKPADVRDILAAVMAQTGRRTHTSLGVHQRGADHRRHPTSAEGRSIGSSQRGPAQQRATVPCLGRLVVEHRHHEA